MTILLIVFSFVLVFVKICSSGKSSREKFRIAFIKTSIIYSIMIVGLTELLSISQSLNYLNLTIFWSAFLLITFFSTYSSIHKSIYAWIGQLFDRIKKSQQALKKLEVISVVIILVVCLITAIIAPPNNWDVMTYHMPRVMHWVQNQSVAHYPTNNTRQISFSPGAAYLVTQFQILSGGDYFANCVQWLAFLGCIIGTSLITKLLIGRKAELIGALVCASLPMAIMQSTTAQTDLVLAFWLVCFTYFIFRTNNYGKSDLFWLAASLGLGILTKPTAIIFGFPLGVILFARILSYSLKTFDRKHLAFGQCLWKILVVIFGSLALSIPTYWRNWQTFGNLLGNDGNDTKNTVLGLTQLISNVLKNIAINLIIPGFWSVVEFVHNYILHVNLNDLSLNYTDISKYITLSGSLRFLAPNEDFIASPIHLILFVLAGYTLLLNLIRVSKVSDLKPKKNELLALVLAIITAFLLFSSLLKWQAWGNRLMLPLFILSSPAIAYYLCCVISERTRKALLFSIATIAIVYALTTMRHPLVALPVLTAEQSREQSPSILFLKRQDIYFSGVRKELRTPYHAATDLIDRTQCQYVGLALGYDDSEYPFWVLLQGKEDKSKPIQIKNVNVQNLSSKQTELVFPDRNLCAVISTIDSYTPAQFVNSKSSWQSFKISQNPYIQVYRKSPN